MSRRETPLESHIQVRNLIAKLQYHITYKTLPPTQLSPNEVTRLNELFHANQYFNRFATPKQRSSIVVGQMKTKAAIDASGSLPRPTKSQMRPVTTSAKVSSAFPPPTIAYAGDEVSGASTGLALLGKSSAVGYTPRPSAASAQWAIKGKGPQIRPLQYLTPGGAPLRPSLQPGSTPTTANVQNTNAHSSNPEQQFAVKSVPNLPQPAPHHYPVGTPPPPPPASTSTGKVQSTDGYSAKPEQQFVVNPAPHHYPIGTPPPSPPTTSQRSNAPQMKKTAPKVNPPTATSRRLPGSGYIADPARRAMFANVEPVPTPAPKPTNAMTSGGSMAPTNPHPPTQNKVLPSRPMVLSTPLVPGKPAERTSTALSSNVPVPSSKPTPPATPSQPASLNAPANLKPDARPTAPVGPNALKQPTVPTKSAAPPQKFAATSKPSIASTSHGPSPPLPAKKPAVSNAIKQQTVPTMPAVPAQTSAAAAKPSVASTSHAPSPQPPAKNPVSNTTAANTATRQNPPAAAQQPAKVTAQSQTSQIQPRRNVKPRQISRAPVTSSSAKQPPTVQQKPVFQVQQAQQQPAPSVPAPQASADHDVDMDCVNSSTNVGTVPTATPAPPPTIAPPSRADTDDHMDTTPDPVPRPAPVATTARIASTTVQAQLPPASTNATVNPVLSTGFVPSIPSVPSALAKPTAPPHAPSLLSRLQPALTQNQAPSLNRFGFAPVQNGPASTQSASLTPPIPSLLGRLGPSQSSPATGPKKTDSHPPAALAVAALPTPGFLTGLGGADKAKVVSKQTLPASGQPSAILRSPGTGSPYEFYHALLDLPSPESPKRNPLLINFVLSPTASPSDASSGYAKELNSSQSGVFGYRDEEDTDEEEVELELGEDRSRGLTLADLVTTKEAAARLAFSSGQGRHSNIAKKVRFVEVEESSSSDETSSTVEDSDDTHGPNSTMQDHCASTKSQTSPVLFGWSLVDVILFLFVLSWLLLSYVF